MKAVTRGRTIAAVLVTAAAVAAVPAFGAAGPATRSAQPRINMLGGASFVPNRYIQDKLRFEKDVYSLKSGATIQLRSRTPGEPHTVSVVSRTDFPKTIAGFDKCFEGGICGQLAQAHGFPEGDGPATTPLVNKGADGFDVRGDSIVIAPPRPGARDSVKLTAKKGKTLYLLCVIHPWMQAKIVTR